MVFVFRKYLLLISVSFFSKLIFAEMNSELPHHVFTPRISVLLNIPDTASRPKKSIKICSCQILIFQINERRQKNFALFAEKTNRKSFASDVSFTRRIIEKEKRHMRAYFYDKLEVVGAFSDAIDCRSMYKKLKDKDKSLFLYDILDADIRR